MIDPADELNKREQMDEIAQLRESQDDDSEWRDE